MRPVRTPALLLLTAWALAACPYVGQERFEELKDYDGDGLVAERFGGDDCDDHDPAIGDCDLDDDGFRDLAIGGDDCDDRNPAVNPGADEICNEIDDDCDGRADDDDDDVSGASVWFRDADHDGFGDAGSTVAACVAPGNYLDDATDCDDQRSDIHPGAVEFCDALDRNCDGDPYVNAVDPGPVYADTDGDGWGAGPEINFACVAGAGESTTDDDCDDGEPAVHPGAVEVWYDGLDSDCAGDDDFDQDGDGQGALAEGAGPDCDDLDDAINTDGVEVCGNEADDDCDGLVDSDDVDAIGRNTFFQDLDGDGEGNALVPGLFCPNDVDFTRWVTNDDDCDDDDADVNTGQTELCNGLDDNCNGIVDDAGGLATFYRDADGDGFGDEGSMPLVCGEAGYVSAGGDCNDDDPAVYPGAPEICGDGRPTDCLRDPDDCDGDGHRALAAGGDDCDDTQATVYPLAPEVCNDTLDNDCDTFVNGEGNEAADGNDVDPATATNWFEDADGDGYGNATDPSPVFSCQVVPGKAPNDDDCNDSVNGGASIHPGALEICNGVSDDCDGFIDEAPLAGPLTYYQDLDEDGVGTADNTYAVDCDPPPWAWSTIPGDCDDSNPYRQPFELEVCDGIDNDCDLLVDEADPSASLFPWFRDDDDDGYGWMLDHYGCEPLEDGNHYVTAGGDCDDQDPDRNPGAQEICNDGIDDDCDTLPDFLDPDLTGNVSWYPDDDADGFGDSTAPPVEQCGAPVNHVTNNLDCDDGKASISPVAAEICDGRDNDCDGLTDDLDDNVIGGSLFYLDADGDGFGDPLSPHQSCAPTAGYVLTATDCNDGDPDLFPGQILLVTPIGGAWTSIQQAIDAACPNGEVRVTGGTWSEQIDLRGKGLVVGGLDPESPPTLLGAAAPAIVATNDEPAGTAIENLRIVGSIGVDGAAAAVGSGSDVRFENVAFEGLVATGNGGAVWVSGGDVAFTACTFASTDAANGGAIYALNAAITLVDTVFEDTHATVQGSALYAQNTDIIGVNLALANHTGGSAIRAGADASHYVSLSGVTLTNTDRPLRFEDIDVYLEGIDSWGSLGRLYAAGVNRSARFEAHDVVLGGNGGTEHAIELYGPQLDATLTNLTVYDNASGGLLAQSVSGLVLENSSFVGNGTTGLLFSSGLSALVRNNIVFGNGSFPELAHSGSWNLTATVSYNLFGNGAEAGTWGASNLAADPQLVAFDPSLSGLSWDLHPRETSPALDAGDPSISDVDGSRSDIGAIGGPRGDAFWYTDADGDGMPDGWETEHFGSPSQRAGTEDDDVDGLDTFLEYLSGTDPRASDTDLDGVPDGVDGAPLDPLSP